MGVDVKDIKNLVIHAQNGDMEAFALLYKECYSILFGVAMSVSGDTYEAQDGVQDAYLRILDSLNSLSKPEYFISWAKRITYNVCLRRMSRKRDILSGEIVDLADNNLEALPSPEAYFESSERQEALLEAVDSLPEHYQVTFKLKNYEDYSVAEIAKILGCPEGTVKSRLSSARRLIIERLKKSGYFNSFGLWIYPASSFVPLVESVSRAQADTALGVSTAIASTGALGATGGLSSLGNSSSLDGVNRSKSLISRVGQYSTHLAGGSSVAPIACGVVATIVVGGTVVGTGYFAETDAASDTVVTTEELVYVEHDSIHDDVAPDSSDITLPLLLDYSSQDGTFTIFVDDVDSGIDFDATHCVLSDGSRLDAFHSDSVTGRIDFTMPNIDFTVYIADLSGNIQDAYITVTTH